MRPTRRPLVLILLLLAVGVLVVDQVSKVWAVSNLTEGERTAVLGDLLGLSLLYNPGAALSFATGMTWVFTIAAVVVSVVILRVANRLGSRGWTIALGLLLGGAVGNLADRLLRQPGLARGHVVDFIAYGNLFVGNVADIAIVSAACLIVLLTLLGIGVDGTRTSRAADAEVLEEGQESVGSDAPGTADDALRTAEPVGAEAVAAESVTAESVTAEPATPPDQLRTDAPAHHEPRHAHRADTAARDR